MKRITLALVALGVLLASAPANAALITTFNTGVDALGNPLSGGSLDPHWSIMAGPGITNPISGVVISDQLRNGNYAQSANSRWIWENASGAAGTNAPYTFLLTFNLTGFDPTTAVLSGAWGVDNDGSILLNGSAPIGSGALALGGGDVSGNFNAFHGFQITGGFVSGINNLEFQATDLGVVGGLNVNGLALTASPSAPASAVPEPTSVTLLVSGVLGLLGYGWRRRKQAAA
jgi:hypothetical protein